MADIIPGLSNAWELPALFRERGKKQEDTEFLKSDLAKFQTDPLYEPNISRYNFPTPELSNFLKTNSDIAKTKEAMPVLSRIEDFKSRGWGSDPNFSGQEWTQGLLTTPAFNPTGTVTPNPQNPIAVKSVADFAKNAQSEADLTNVGNSILSGQTPQPSTLARFLAEGGDKSTNMAKTLTDLAKQNTDFKRAQGTRTWINAAGQSPDVV